MIITIDGPAGTGKTTVARRVAECLHFAYFDTGAMYRAVAYFLLKNRIDLEDEEKIELFLSQFTFAVEVEGREKRYRACGEDITDAIRSQEVTGVVSAVSALPLVRKTLWKIQRSFAQKTHSVFEGRDMGTVVFPKADLKIFLTARPEVRAQRRLDEILRKCPEDAERLDPDKMLEDIMKRDSADSTRALAPLKCPEDAFIVDTSDLSIDEVVARILQHKMEVLP